MHGRVKSWMAMRRGRPSRSPKGRFEVLGNGPQRRVQSDVAAVLADYHEAVGGLAFRVAVSQLLSCGAQCSNTPHASSVRGCTAGEGLSED